MYIEKQGSKLNIFQVCYNTHPVILKWMVANLLAIMFFFVLSSIFIV